MDMTDTFYYAFQKSIETVEMMALVFLQSTDDMLTNECNNCLCITKKKSKPLYISSMDMATM